EELPEIFVPPVPVQERGDNQIEWRHVPDPQIYERDTFYPADLARVDPPAQFRQQSIVRVQVMPVQYNPVKRQLRVYRELQIVVRFVGGSSLPMQTFSAALSSPAEEEFYQNLLVNYEQAKAFRDARSTQLLRSASPQIEGPLYKFALRQEGIYKIDGQTLSKAGVNLAEVNPSTIHLYNNGGRELPRNINAPRPQGLVENAIYVSDGGDGRFDDNDFILFYGRGVEGFAFDSTSGAANHYINHFGYDNYYWLSFGGANGKRMAARAPLPVSGLTPATNFKDNLFVEEELNPLFESDQTWYGWLFSSSEAAQTRRYRVKLIDPIADSRANMEFVFYTPFGPGNNTSQLTVTFEKQDLAEWQMFGSSRPQSYNLEKAGGLNNGDNEIALTFRGSNDAAQLY
ncbi:MAG: C25 family peptidase propeptide domain-containing protein, partial [bacterium]